MSERQQTGYLDGLVGDSTNVVRTRYSCSRRSECPLHCEEAGVFGNLHRSPVACMLIASLDRDLRSMRN